MSWRDFEDDSITKQVRSSLHLYFTKSHLPFESNLFVSLWDSRSITHLRMHKRHVLNLHVYAYTYTYIHIHNTLSCWIRWHNAETAAQTPGMLVNWEIMNQMSTRLYTFRSLICHLTYFIIRIKIKCKFNNLKQIYHFV